MEFTVPPCPLALANGVASNAAHRFALEDVEVDVLMVSFRGDRARTVRVPHHDVSIGAHLDRPLARVEVEDFGGVGGGDRDKFLGR